MLRIERSVLIDGNAITITVVYDKDGLSIKKQRNDLAVEMLEFTLAEAEVLQDLMDLTNPTHDNGMPY
jgi:hypothetical protein